jgi:DNA modification methylase
MPESFLGGKVTLHLGDCMEVLQTLPADSVDACVTDAPYHLTSIVKRFGKEGSAPAQFGTDGRFARASAGFMGRKWDGGDIAFRPELWAEVMRVLKPGAHMLAFGGTRTYHRMACAIEDAGFEIRDCIQWLYGSGFPKSHDVSKGIDRAAGAEREVVGPDPYAKNHPNPRGAAVGQNYGTDWNSARGITAPATDAARQWQGWGTALKPACEPIVLARKPLSEKTVAANVLKWGTGAINVDGCRIKFEDEDARRKPVPSAGWCIASPTSGSMDDSALAGRWPANVIHDGSEEVVKRFPDTGISSGGRIGNAGGGDVQNIPVGKFSAGNPGLGDEGSAARFFYQVKQDANHAASGTRLKISVSESGWPQEQTCKRFWYTSKADADDRVGSAHPTVKPLDLMQYLVRLVTPKGGLVLDCFAGTGTTGEAAFREGMRAVLIEREAEYQIDVRRRMELCLAGPDERIFKSQKARQDGKPVDAGPLFGGKSDWDDMWRKPFDKPDLVWGK